MRKTMTAIALATFATVGFSGAASAGWTDRWQENAQFEQEYPSLMEDSQSGVAAGHIGGPPADAEDAGNEVSQIFGGDTYTAET